MAMKTNKKVMTDYRCA